jgi:gluconolactonase
MHRIALGAIFLVGCSAGDGDTGDAVPSFTGSPSPGAGMTGAVSGAATGGRASTAPAASGAPAGAASEGNPSGAPIAPMASGGAAPAPAGGTTPSTPGSAGAPATAQPPAEPDPVEPTPAEPAAGGPFVSRPVSGGASAAFVCPRGVAFGNPLDGMGAVQTIAAPNGNFFAFIEGPVWVGSVGRLFFSDNASNPLRIWQLTPPSTTPEIFLADSGSNGLALDNADQLLLADQSDLRVTRVSSATAANLGDVVPSGQHKPNDLVMRSDDNLYFTDPDSQGRGLYRAAPDGTLSGPFTQANAANAPNAPNGVVLSPDENTLYVGDVQQRFVASFPLLVDGAIDTASAAVFVRTMGDTVDGMAVDCAGNLYVGTRTGVEVYAPDATFIGTVPTGESSNATFGGADRRTLFVTSRALLKSVTLGVPGLPD